MKKMIRLFLFISIPFFVSSFSRTSPRPEPLEKLETEYSQKLPINTNLVLSASSSNARLNDPITFIATLQPAVKISKKPTGSVTFISNGVKICTDVPIDPVNYKASCNARNQTTGSYYVVATYSGQKNFYSPAQTSLEYFVAKLTSKVDLSIMPMASNSPQESWKLSANVNRMAIDVPVTGTVDFFMNTVPISNCTNKKIQEATCQYTAKNTDGAIEFSVQYSGDANYEMSSIAKATTRKNGLVLNLLRNNFNYTTDVSKRGFDFSFGISGNYNQNNISTMKDNLVFSIVKIKSNENYLMEKMESIFDGQEFKNVNCEISSDNSKNGLIATCHAFRPIVNKFNLTVVLKTKSGDVIASQTNSISINSDKIVKTKISDESSISNGCGLNGTTRQRMFDCSLFVSNFGGAVNAQKQFVPYTPGDSSELNWFLVHCPSKGIAQSCAWMSPVLRTGNPVLSNAEFDTNGVPMSNYAGKRILWSGASLHTSTFFQANGNGTNTFQYTAYPLVNENTMAKNDGKTRQISQSICKTGKDLPLFSAQTPYNWQLPSYPMIMTLTGGKYCDADGIGFEQDWKAFCNGGSKPQGGRAILVPSFVKNYLWSSSVDSNNNVAWIFNGTDGGADVTTFDDNCNVRCATFTW